MPKPLFTIRPVGAPCSVNRAYARAGRQTYKTAAAIGWTDAIWAAIIDWRNEQGLPIYGPLPYLLCDIRMSCTFYGVRGDADNYLKVTQDALAMALGLPDDNGIELDKISRDRVTVPKGAEITLRAKVKPLPQLPKVTPLRAIRYRGTDRITRSVSFR